MIIIEKELVLVINGSPYKIKKTILKKWVVLLIVLLLYVCEAFLSYKALLHVLLHLILKMTLLIRDGRDYYTHFTVVHIYSANGCSNLNHYLLTFVPSFYYSCDSVLFSSFSIPKGNKWNKNFLPVVYTSVHSILGKILVLFSSCSVWWRLTSSKLCKK